MKMRSLFFLTFVPTLFSAYSLCADSPINPITQDLPMKEPAQLVANEIDRLNFLIDATQNNLQNQKNLRGLILEYQKTQALYMKNSQDNELLFRMVKQAHRILSQIKENNLAHLFSSEFLGELTLLSQVANKKGLPKP